MSKYNVPAIVLIFLFTSAYLASISLSIRAASEDSWPMFHHNPAHSGYTASSAPTTMPVVLWRFDGISSITSSPAIADGRVYITGYSGDFHCLDAKTGAQIWEARGGESPAVYEGIVYVGHNLITAHNASTGEKIWSDQTLYASGGSSQAIANDVVYTSFLGAIYAYNVSTGTKIWNYTTGDMYSSPAVANGIVYLGGLGVVALNGSTGSKIWNYTPHYQSAPSYRGGSPAVEGGYVYVGLPESFYCFDALTGKKVWGYSNGAYASTPALAFGCVYFGGYDSNIHALNASSGAKIWAYKTGYIVDSSPAIANGAVYVGSGDGNLYALNASSGVKLWNFTLQPFLDEKGFDRYMFASPAIANGVIYMGCNDGILYALGTNSNTTTLPTPSSTIPEFPNQSLAATIVMLLFAIVVGVTVRKKTIKRAR